MSKKFHKVEVVEVTPELATEWLGKNTDNYRSLKSPKTRRYVRDMKNGKWRNTGDPIRFGEDGTLVDGQHRLWALVETGKTYTFIIVSGLTPEDVDALDQGALRTASDVLRRHGVEKYHTGVASTLRLLAGWDNGLITTAGSSVIIDTTQGEMPELLELYPEAEKHQAWAYRVRNLGFTPAAAATARNIIDRVADEDDSDAFWDGVEALVPVDKNDPRRTLAKWARDRKNAKNGRMENSQQLCAIFTAWNAWRDGRTLSNIRIVERAARYDEDDTLISKAVYRDVPEPF